MVPRADGDAVRFVVDASTCQSVSDVVKLDRAAAKIGRDILAEDALLRRYTSHISPEDGDPQRRPSVDLRGDQFQDCCSPSR
jgi:hypothetical protein